MISLCLAVNTMPENHSDEPRSWVAILFKPRGWEIVLFIFLFVTMIILTEKIGGIPIAKEDVGEMYRVTVKGPPLDRMISYELYWAWIVCACVFFPYFIFFAIKYFPYLDARRK